MKTQYIWEDKDIFSGMYVMYQSYPENSDDIGGLNSVAYQVVQAPSGEWNIHSVGCMGINARKSKTMADLLHKLNITNALDYGYRPASKREIMRVLDYNLDIHQKIRDGERYNWSLKNE